MAATAVLAREVFDATGRRIVLRGAGRSGGEGTVYEIEGRPLSLAKIYHPAKVTPELRAKIEAMRAAPPRDVAWDTQRHRSIAWVEQLLFHDAGRTRFAGFTMPAIDTKRFRESHLYFDPQDRVRVFGGGFTWRHLLGAATNLASAIAGVHSQGHRIGDLRETNVLLSPASLIALIDCDSFQIRDASSGRTFYSRVGTADFLPPELHGADFRDDHDRTHADLFALGVLIFKLLMEGSHPYQARGPRVDDLPSTDAKIKRGLFPYERARGVEPPPFAPPYELLPPEVRALFRRCFVSGHKHPSKRPSASEWFKTLKEAGKRMRACRANPNHWFGAHLRRCPWCAMATDPFPQPGVVGRQATVKAPPARAARVLTQPAASPPHALAPPSKPPRWRRALGLFARARRIRIPKRRVIALASTLALLIGLVSPLGHASPPPTRTAVEWSARATGPCPFEPARASVPAPGCRASWSFGPATRITRDARKLFLLRTSSRLLEVSFAVRFGSGDCEIPWIDSMVFNEQASPVCLATCPERIELRGGGAVLPLIRAGGVAGHSGNLVCGKRYTGSWTFDVARARGGLRLHYPGLKDLPLP